MGAVLRERLGCRPAIELRAGAVPAGFLQSLDAFVYHTDDMARSLRSGCRRGDGCALPGGRSRSGRYRG
jgi:hypothetical protein